jgi:hypothetical protein
MNYSTMTDYSCIVKIWHNSICSVSRLIKVNKKRVADGCKSWDLSRSIIMNKILFVGILAVISSTSVYAATNGHGAGHGGHAGHAGHGGHGGHGAGDKHPDVISSNSISNSASTPYIHNHKRVHGGGSAGQGNSVILVRHHHGHALR